MINLLDYGFEKTTESERETTYIKGDLRITIFTYEYKQADGNFSRKNTFVANTKEKMYNGGDISKLMGWLKRRKINKVKS